MPKIDQSLLSVPQMVNNGYTHLFSNNQCSICDPSKKEITIIAMEDKSFSLNHMMLWRSKLMKLGYSIKDLVFNI